jgi:peroxiredoxin
MKLLIVALALSANAFALETGTSAPDFKLKAASGKEVSLSDYKEKIVVLEWKNHGCPFVVKHYDSGNMQSIQKKYTDKDVVWFSVISSAPGKQGHVDEKQALAEKTQYKSAATDVLLDPTGKVGKMYGAKTTPHMYIVDKGGKLVYQGAIDNRPDAEQESVKIAKNYVSSALDEIIAGKAVTQGTTNSYGCSVKYE